MLTHSYVLPAEAAPCSSFFFVAEMNQKEHAAASHLNSTDFRAMVEGHKVISHVQQTVENFKDSKGFKGLQELSSTQAQASLLWHCLSSVCVVK